MVTLPDGGAEVDASPAEDAAGVETPLPAPDATSTDSSLPADSSSTDSGSAPDVLAARRVTQGPTIDGLLDDPAWQGAPSVEFSNVKRSSNKVRVLTAWDASALYLAFDVDDTQLEAVDMAIHNDDGVEILLDTGYDRQMKLDANDYHFMFSISGKSFTQAPASAKFAARTGGYVIEIAIPWAGLMVTPAAGMNMGLLLGNNERDSGISTQFDWTDVIDRSSTYDRPDLWGTLVLGGQ